VTHPDPNASSTITKLSLLRGDLHGACDNGVPPET